MKPMRPLPSRVAGALICLWATLLSVQLPILGCASQRPIRVADPGGARELGLLTVERGSPMRVWLRDGNKVEGDYQGIERLDSAVYAERYDAWRAQAPMRGWPALGDSVRLGTVYGGTRVGRFEGFDWGVVRLRVGAESELTRFEEMRTMSTPVGATFTADTLARLREAGRLPLASQLVLYAGPGQRTGGANAIALDRVERVEVKQGSQWVAAVIVAALAGTVMAVLVVRSIFQDAFDDCGGTTRASLRPYPSPPMAHPEPVARR